jgi:hypothetical protein
VPGKIHASSRSVSFGLSLVQQCTDISTYARDGFSSSCPDILDLKICRLDLLFLDDESESAFENRCALNPAFSPFLRRPPANRPTTRRYLFISSHATSFPPPSAPPGPSLITKAYRPAIAAPLSFLPSATDQALFLPSDLRLPA